ncbi:TPA: ATP-binding protein [Escherichia coli]|nr:ATP-binding protein [Escherichia coli]HCW2891655.1 ATP-binding protein [Escherichia coli]HCW2938407.1 ATP-binding protein [Escherichia coli]HDX6653705.1 ATP-binding protein [Escherichia coli]
MLDVDKLIHSSKDYFVLVGKNGSGKSRMLHDLAEATHDLGYSTIVVSNTLFDKFEVHPQSDNYNYIGGKLGRNFPAQAIKKTLSTKNEKRVSRIFSILSYIGYDTRVGIKISFRKKFKDAMTYTQARTGDYIPVYFDDSDENLSDELKMAVDKSIHQTHYGYSDLVWLRDGDSVFYEGSFDSYLLLLRNERLLKRAKIISGIEIFLSKDNYAFPLNHASSGELSFIALLVHIAFCVSNRSFIFIDEPENSLHPKWQNEYFELLNGVIGYNECTTVVATHSPLIISSLSENKQAAIYKRDNEGFNRVNSYDDSAEELYIDYFDTLTPKNRALSNRCVDIIDLFSEGTISLSTAKERLSKYLDMANDVVQKEFLIGVDDLLEKVADKKGTVHD